MESHPFEVEIVVRARGQPDARINREYLSEDAASTEKCAREMLQGFKDDVRVRFRAVNDDG